jgi:small subunit ribosomal protein S8
MRHDPLNDALTAIRNAVQVGHDTVEISPASHLIGRVLHVMQEHRYISQFEIKDDGRGGVFTVKLNGAINDCGVIKPRFAVRLKAMEKYEKRYLPGQDFGVLILSTTKGVMAHAAAKQERLGGRLLAYVY